MQFFPLVLLDKESASMGDCCCCSCGPIGESHIAGVPVKKPNLTPNFSRCSFNAGCSNGTLETSVVEGSALGLASDAIALGLVVSDGTAASGMQMLSICSSTSPKNGTLPGGFLAPVKMHMCGQNE